MKNPSKIYAALSPKQAAMVAWGLAAQDLDASAQVIASVPHGWRWGPTVEVATTHLWLQSVVLFWSVLHLKLLNQRAYAITAHSIANNDDELMKAFYRLKDCERDLLASDAALDEFAEAQGFNPQTVRAQVQLERFVPMVPDLRADENFCSLVKASLMGLSRNG